jgi:protein arginine N-methyltransferase 5
MNLPAVLLPELPNQQQDVEQYAWQLQTAILNHVSKSSFQLWVPITLGHDNLLKWQLLSSMCNYDLHVGICLDLCELSELSTADCIARHLQLLHTMLGLPILCVRIHATLFLTNKGGFPTLAKSHQVLVTELLRRIGRTCRFLVQGSSLPNKHTPKAYLQYLQHLRKRPEVREMLDTNEAIMERDYLDGLQRPLQPLQDHLEFHTYETFEKDPVKYAEYQRAMTMVMIDIHNNDKETTATTTGPLTLFVIGAGRGPLVTCALHAHRESHISRPIRIVAVEKNPSAICYLQSKAAHDALWQQHDVAVICCDLRDLTLEQCQSDDSTSTTCTADIVVSELLGSFGDNELSPECLDAFYQTPVCRADTICIPGRYTSFLSPASSVKLHQQVMEQALYPNEFQMGMLGRTVAMETPYVVRPHACSQTHRERECWSFGHPTTAVVDHERHVVLDFLPSPTSGCGLGSGYGAMNAKAEALASISSSSHSGHAWTMTGLLGTFTADLYCSTTQPENVSRLSIAPSHDFSVGMFSWFPLYFPLERPVHVPAGASVRVHMSRKVDALRVWYEWSVSIYREDELLSTTPIHNPAGRSYQVGLR